MRDIGLQGEIQRQIHPLDDPQEALLEPKGTKFLVGPKNKIIIVQNSIQNFQQLNVFKTIKHIHLHSKYFKRISTLEATTGSKNFLQKPVIIH